MSKIEQVQIGDLGLESRDKINEALKDVVGEGAQIKIEYESQTDTNAFTDSDKTKLDALNANDQGFYATPTDLRTAIPVGQPGWFATVGSTDTVWVWDVGTNDWVDSGNSGLVNSVNGKVGTVTLNTDEVPEGTNNKYVSASQKTNIDTAIQPGDNISELTNDAGYAVGELRRGRQSVLRVDNPTTINFSALTDSSYSLNVRTFDINGYWIGFKISNETDSSFDIEVDYDCTIDFILLR